MYQETISYDQLQAAVDLAGLEMRASEVHGMVCGEICRQLRLGEGHDFPALLGISEESIGAGRTLLQTVTELAEQSRKSLDDGMEFSLLVPGDEEGVGERTISLADWARGFALALLRGEKMSIKDLDESSAEVVEDLLKISEAQPGDETDEDERALTEIEEYMRVGVQLVFEGLHPDADGQPLDGSIH